MGLKMRAFFLTASVVVFVTSFALGQEQLSYADYDYYNPESEWQKIKGTVGWHLFGGLAAVRGLEFKLRNVSIWYVHVWQWDSLPAVASWEVSPQNAPGQWMPSEESSNELIILLDYSSIYKCSLRGLPKGVPGKK